MIGLILVISAVSFGVGFIGGRLCNLAVLPDTLPVLSTHRAAFEAGFNAHPKDGVAALGKRWADDPSSWEFVGGCAADIEPKAYAAWVARQAPKDGHK